MSAISERAERFINFDFLMEKYFKQVAANPYDKDTNLNGVIDMGSSTNGIVNDLIMERLKTVDMSKIPVEYFDTCEVQGPLRFRQIMANYFNRYSKPSITIEPDDIFTLAGAGSCFESIGYALCNPGDVILVPRPYYYQFDHEFRRVAGAKLETFPICHEKDKNGSTRCFIKEEDLQLAYKNALSKGGSVIKALLIVNPNNPMGYVFDEATLKLCVHFCNQHNLHLISDEIYMNCVFGKPSFQSVLNVLPNKEDMLNKTHIIWAFSKDFAVAGFRVGILITKNKQVNSVINEDLNKRVSNLTLYALENIAKDFTWLDTIYFPTFSDRLSRKTTFIRTKLEELGVNCFDSKAGLFLWANFQKYLRSNDFESEEELFEMFMKNGIYVSPGKAFKEQQPGWFRVITSLEQDRIENGLNRIAKTVTSIKH